MPSTDHSFQRIGGWFGVVPGQQVALTPARPLPDPGFNLAARFFPGHRGEKIDPIALFREAQPQLAIFGHVEGIPAGHLFQNVYSDVIARAAQARACPNEHNPGTRKSKLTSNTPK